MPKKRVDQPTSAPTPKVAAAWTAGALTGLLALTATAMGWDAPPENLVSLVEPVATILGPVIAAGVAAYMVRDEVEEEGDAAD